MKQETLEEAAESFFNKRAKEEGFENWTQIIVQQEWKFIESFPIEFAKWQQKQELYFVHWLMDNCELAEDNSLWMYNSEEYSVEGLFKIYQQFKNK